MKKEIPEISPATATHFPKDEYLTRMRRVEAAMERAGLDMLIGYSVKNQPGPVAYLGGYETRLGLHDVAFFTVAPEGDPRYALLTNAFWDYPHDLTWTADVIISSDFGNKLVSLMPRNVRAIGIAGYKFFPTPAYRALRSAFPSAKIEDATKLLMDVTKIKTPLEIEALRVCSRITDAGGRAFLESVREGANEREVEAEVQRAILLAGSDGFWYQFQVYCGPQVAVGMGLRTDRTIKRGDQVQVDCGALYKGYHGDFSRVATVGPVSADARAIMEATAEMYERMFDKLHPGVPVAEVARTGLQVAKAHGMESYLYQSPNHGSGFVGHGIGCFYHEAPDVHPDDDSVVEANMVVVLEPILGKWGIGGAKIEDTILVTLRGPERLSSIDIRTW